jgi:syntaxin 5
MTLKDRTSEFTSIAEHKRREFQHNKASSALESKRPSKSEFAQLAAGIGKGIKDTSDKLANLTKLARNRDLFVDKTQEIQELTFVIKHDIDNLKRDIGVLQEYVDNGKGQKNTVQSKSNSKIIVESLNSKLKSTVKDFKEALELRNENLKKLQETRKVFTGDGLSKRPELYRPISYASTESVDEGGSVVINMSQPLLLETMQPANVSLDRLNTVVQIEKTIVELGEIFSELGRLVAEQDTLVMRIDNNVGEILHNTTKAEDELRKYLHRISSNRWLIIKIFAILFLFIFIFFFFFA